jgi:hypothetical protein
VNFPHAELPCDIDTVIELELIPESSES